MKKLVIGSTAAAAVVLLFVAIVFNKPQFGGLQAHQISSAELAGWAKNSQELIFDTSRNEFYIQETIGSNGITLTSPQTLKGDVVIQFKLLSREPASDVSLNTHQSFSHNYLFAVKNGLETSRPEIRKDRKSLASGDSEAIEPESFYQIELGKMQEKLWIKINGVDVVQATDDEPLQEGRIRFNIQGAADRPAAVIIKDLVIYN